MSPVPTFWFLKYYYVQREPRNLWQLLLVIHGIIQYFMVLYNISWYNKYKYRNVHDRSVARDTSDPLVILLDPGVHPGEARHGAPVAKGDNTHQVETVWKVMRDTDCYSQLATHTPRHPTASRPPEVLHCLLDRRQSYC